MTKSYFKDNKEKYYNQQFQNTPRKIQIPLPNAQVRKFPSKKQKKPTTNKQNQKQKEYIKKNNKIKKMQSPQIHWELNQKSAEIVRPKKNSPPRNQAKSQHFTYHKESSQSIHNGNLLSGFHKRRAPIKRYFKTA